MHNKLYYIYYGDYCEFVQPTQLTVLTRVRAPSLLEQHPRNVFHRDHAGCNTTSCADCLEIWTPNILEPSVPVQACNRIAFVAVVHSVNESAMLKMSQY
jgi:hypothetical protein